MTGVTGFLPFYRDDYNPSQTTNRVQLIFKSFSVEDPPLFVWIGLVYAFLFPMLLAYLVGFANPSRKWIALGLLIFIPGAAVEYIFMNLEGAVFGFGATDTSTGFFANAILNLTLLWNCFVFLMGAAWCATSRNSLNRL